MVISFMRIIERSKIFWRMQGCTIQEGYDLEVGAGTYHPDVVFSTMTHQKKRIAFVQPSRRPFDSRKGAHANRLQKHHQFQVLLSPAPENVRDLVLKYFEFLGCDRLQEDIRFIKDDWTSPTLGAGGYGYEVWINGMEVLQLTYFQQMGGKSCSVVPVEFAFGLERLALALNPQADSIYDIQWDDTGIRYSYVFMSQEKEFSEFNLMFANTEMTQQHLNDNLNESLIMSKQHRLPRVGYELFLKANHLFNVLEARGILGAVERTDYIRRLRQVASAALNTYVDVWKEYGEDIPTAAVVV